MRRGQGPSRGRRSTHESQRPSDWRWSPMATQQLVGPRVPPGTLIAGGVGAGAPREWVPSRSNFRVAYARPSTSWRPLTSLPRSTWRAAATRAMRSSDGLRWPASREAT